MAGCSLETIDTFSASKRSAKKLPIEISVSAGTLDQEPFYIFKNSKGKTIKNLKINPKKTYVFSREKMAESHPFYISDIGFNQENSKAIKIQGDGQYDDGITGQESFELSFPKNIVQISKTLGHCLFTARLILQCSVISRSNLQTSNHPIQSQQKNQMAKTIPPRVSPLLRIPSQHQPTELLTAGIPIDPWMI